jgi:hypothetical protein
VGGSWTRWSCVAPPLRCFNMASRLRRESYCDSRLVPCRRAFWRGAAAAPCRHIPPHTPHPTPQHAHAHTAAADAPAHTQRPGHAAAGARPSRQATWPCQRAGERADRPAAHLAGDAPRARSRAIVLWGACWSGRARPQEPPAAGAAPPAPPGGMEACGGRCMAGPHPPNSACWIVLAAPARLDQATAEAGAGQCRPGPCRLPPRCQPAPVPACCPAAVLPAGACPSVLACLPPCLPAGQHFSPKPLLLGALASATGAPCRHACAALHLLRALLAPAEGIAAEQG